ncbi:MAG: 16S rRNA (uracil(1498)-N(3))-methyltransferase [Gammaproteobacteria bacterium]|nr:16S rRNA (uracil(1498)-N(3))-methyltransferase [Gammaproteobacteria bacterium]
MRLSRFFISGALTVGSEVQLSKEVSSHIHRVLRLKVENEIQLFNGNGNNYQANITHIGKVVSVNIHSSAPGNKESALVIHLGQAISRGERMDFTLQKAVELGVTTITPLISERVQFRFDDKRIKRKMSHWQKIIESACEQSGRTQITQLNQPVELQQWLTISEEPGLLFEPNATARLTEIEQSSAIRLLVGPEGGLSDNEIQTVLENTSFKAVSLGPRILRTETAALSAISILQAIFGDI